VLQVNQAIPRTSKINVLGSTEVAPEIRGQYGLQRDQPNPEKNRRITFAVKLHPKLTQ